jgi:hypothetical protein
MQFENFNKSFEEQVGPDFRTAASLESSSRDSRGFSRLMQEKQEHPALPSLVLQNSEGAVFSLAASNNHGAAYQQCVAAVKHALADPRQNTQHIHRSEQWISNRCAVAESNHNKNINQHPRHSSGDHISKSHSDERNAKHQEEENKYRQEREAESKRNQQRYEQRRQEELDKQRRCQHWRANPHMNLTRPEGCF